MPISEVSMKITNSDVRMSISVKHDKVNVHGTTDTETVCFMRSRAVYQ